MDQYNRSKVVMVRSSSTDFDLAVPPSAVTTVQLIPIDPDFFEQLAQRDPPAAGSSVVQSDTASSTDFPQTAQEFPVIGKISMSLRDINGNDISVDAHVLIHYLGEIPTPAPVTATGTGTGTGTGTETDTGKLYLKIISGGGNYEYGDFIHFVATHSADVSGIKWVSDLNGDFAGTAIADESELMIGTHTITVYGYAGNVELTKFTKVIVREKK